MSTASLFFLLASLAKPTPPPPHPRVLRTRFDRFFFRVRQLQRGCEQSRHQEISLSSSLRTRSKAFTGENSLLVIFLKE